TILTIQEVKKSMLDFLEYTDGNGFSSSEPFLENMKPCVFGDIIFDTEEEAIEYEFANDELYDKIRHLKSNDKVIQFFDEDDQLSYIPFEE
ncbi:MAG: hypothetical protein JXQ76_06905, partial [Campylobacterales bacterium]|nr:hypothetical protein [Campylobacterales bacterium]